MESTTTHSFEVNELAAALHAFQSEVEAVKRDGMNPFFKSKYATLENVVDATRPLLAKHGLAVSQFPVGLNGVKTVLFHKSGQYWYETYEMEPKERSPHAQASVQTYMRRYAYGGVLGLVFEEDDDGNAATTPVTKAPQRRVTLTRNEK